MKQEKQRLILQIRIYSEIKPRYTKVFAKLFSKSGKEN